MSVLDLVGKKIHEPQLKAALRDAPQATSIRVKYDDYDDHYSRFSHTLLRISDDSVGVARPHYLASESRNRCLPFEFVEKTP